MIVVHLIIGAPLRSAKKIYAVAGVLSIVLYVAGVATGYYLQGDVSQVFESEISDVREDISAVEQELPLLSLRGEGSCRILTTLSSDINGRLGNIAERIISIENQGVRGENYEKLIEDYTSLTVRGWILSRDIQQSCSGDRLTILYFYSVPCADCIEQGRVLDQMKEKYGNKISVFVLNRNIDQSAVNILANSFNITETPALVIESKAFEGIVTAGQLEDAVCVKTGDC